MANKNETIYADMVALLDAGLIAPGTRLPSVRVLSMRFHVSVATVLKVYYRLEAEGRVEAREKSGFYMLGKTAPPALLTPQAAVADVSVAGLIATLFDAAGPRAMPPFGTATPASAILPVDELNAVLRGITRRTGDLGFRYELPPGNLQLRTEIARRSVACGCALAPDDVIVTNGATEALYLCLAAVTQRGDTVAVESPAYFGILQIVETLGLRVVEIPTDPRCGLDIEALLLAVDSRGIRACITVPTFHNPLGGSLPVAARKRLALELAIRGVPLIEDDVYGELAFDGVRPPPIKSFDTKGLILLCSSFSKVLAPGYRIGWCAPGREKAAVLQRQRVMNLGTASFEQAAVAEYLRTGLYDRHLKRLRAALQLQVAATQAAIIRHFPVGTHVSRPEGGFVLWVEFAPAVDTVQLYHQALEHGISFAPGAIFSPRQQYGNYARLSCGHPWTPQSEADMATLGELVRLQVARA